jgi:transposase InsO family protein
MRLRGVDVVEQRLDMVRAVEEYGLTVTEAAALWGVSRETWHKWRRRYEAEGIDGLADRSTRPARSPNRIAGRLEQEIVQLRTDHPRWGPRRLRAELRRRGLNPPAVSTVQAVFARNGLTAAPVPKSKPTVRFQRERPNELWQIDGKEWVLDDATEVSILSVLDDCSRRCLAIDVVVGDFDGADAIAVFDAAVAEGGIPAAVLADRGHQFTARRHKAVSAFERHVWATGAYTLNGRPYHPQTQGKIERFHRTMGEWLEDHGPFAAIGKLGRSLDAFRHDYNNLRPHQGIADLTPAEMWSSIERAVPDPDANLDRRRRECLRSTRANGNISYAQWVIGLGMGWANTKVRVVDVGHTIEIYAGDELIRAVVPDATKTYLGTGRKPKGRAPRQLP